MKKKKKNVDDRESLIRLVSAVLHRRNAHPTSVVCPVCFSVADEVVDVLVRALVERAADD